MYCVKCGEKFDDNLKYCPFCGTSIDAPTPEPENKGDALGPFPEVKIRNNFLYYLMHSRPVEINPMIFIWYFPIFFIFVFLVAIIFALLSVRFLSVIAGIIGIAALVLFKLIKNGKIKAKKPIAVILVVIVCICIAAYLFLFKYDFSYLF
jgi:hypothetical protein